jgi:hypothetical protein
MNDRGAGPDGQYGCHDHHTLNLRLSPLEAITAFISSGDTVNSTTRFRRL